MGTLENAQLSLGDQVSVTVGKKTRYGEIVLETAYFYTVQFPNYKESFLKVDITIGAVKIEKGDPKDE